MVAAGRVTVIVTLALLASLSAIPGAGAVDASPGLRVAEAEPVDVTHLVNGDVDAAAVDVPETDVDAAADPVDDAVPETVPDAPVTPDATARVPDAAPLDAAQALVTLPDAGFTPDELVTAFPELEPLLEETPATPAPEPAPVAAPAVAAGTVGAAALSLVFQPPLAGGRLYTRLAPGEALNHPVRRKLYALIERNPGAYPNALRGEAGLGNGALLYHLDVLRRQRLITRVDAGRFTRYYVTGRYSPGEMRSHAAMLAGSAARVFQLVRDRPGIAVKEAAEAVGLSAPSVHRTAARLENAGLLERRRQGRGHALYPAAETPMPAMS